MASSGVARSRPAGQRPLLTALKIILVRFRFFIVLLLVLLLVGYWKVVRTYWDKLTHSPGIVEGAISPDTEYWCPMCPGVLSDWPGKCPVCNMALVRRQKSEAVPLPNGVVARMQLSPERVQLAGIQTSPVDFRVLTQEIVAAGFIESATAGQAFVPVDIRERDISFVQLGQAVEATSDAFPGKTFSGMIDQLSPQVSSGTLRVRARLENSRQELRPGMFLTLHSRVPLTQIGWLRQARLDEWRDRTTIDLIAHGGVASLFWMAPHAIALERGLVLAVPETAVVDTGSRKVVFVERMRGMFVGVEVTLGRRCGQHYPVLSGLEPGQQVVTAGAFLLDAETRLNPSVAASYFGASGAARPAGKSTSEDEALIARQKLCPVSGAPLGSMGAPYRVVVEGQVVFLCCDGCEAELRKNPKPFLAKLNGKP